MDDLDRIEMFAHSAIVAGADWMARAQRAEAQREELLAALESLTEKLESMGTLIGHPAFIRAKDAIAKAAS